MLYFVKIRRQNEEHLYVGTKVRNMKKKRKPQKKYIKRKDSRINAKTKENEAKKF